MKRKNFKEFIKSPNRENKNRNINEEDENKSEECGKEKSGSESGTSGIKDMGSVITGSKGRRIYCLTIIGEIEGHEVLPEKNKTTKYEHVIPRLVAVEEDEKIDGMLIILNTVGGDVEAGLAIAELIAGMRKPTVSLVLGGGHSIGVPLAVSTKKSFIAKSATMMLHPVRSSGVTVAAPQSFEYFKRMQNRITEFVVENSNISEKRFKKLVMNTEELAMDVGSVLDGKKAVKEGLIDHVGCLSEALCCLYSMVDKCNLPKD